MGTGEHLGPRDPATPPVTGELDYQSLLDAYNEQLSAEADQAMSLSRSRSTGRSVSSSTSISTRRSVGRDVSFTDQISRRFFDVPTEEAFLNQFENAFSGFAQQAQAAGLGGGDLATMLDPSTGFMQQMLNEYIGELATRAARGEDIYRIVGTEEDFKLLRREPGSESLTRGRSTEVSTGEERGTTESRSLGAGTTESGLDVEREAQRAVGSFGAGTTIGDIAAIAGQEPVTSRSIAESEDIARGTSIGRSTSTSETTRESRFKEIVEVMSRPELAAVFKTSPLDYLTKRFGKLDEKAIGRLSTEIRASKGQKQRIAQTAAGGEVAQARRV